MYNADITRTQKGAVVILIDQSGSMSEEVIFAGKTTTKAAAVASVANSLIDELINNCHRHRTIGDYFDLAVIGYGGESAASLLGSKGFRRITDVNNMPTATLVEPLSFRMPDGRVVESVAERRVWIEPQAKGRTPMGEALTMARKLLTSWCRHNPQSFPPLVINITDGEATDATEEQLLLLAEQIKATTTADGGTLLVNVHIASEYDTVGPTLFFPSESEPLPVNRYTQLLWQMSSTFPEPFNATIGEIKNSATRPPYRAMCYNSSAGQLFSLLNIGSVSIERMI